MQLYGISFQEDSENIAVRIIYCRAMEMIQTLYANSSFYEKYQKYTSVPDFLKNAPEDLYYKFLEDVIYYIMNFLESVEVYDYDFQRVAKVYSKYTGYFLAACNDLNAEYCELKGDARAAQLAREQAKQNRGRFVGGGFGVAGAAKGIAMAGAANLATGAIYSAGNMVGNMLTKLDTDSQINQLRKAYSEKLYQALYGDFMAGIDTLEEILVSAAGTVFQNPFTRERLEKAKAVMNNIGCGRIPEEKEREMLVNALVNDAPYYDELYMDAYEEFGDDNGRLLETAELFGKNALIRRLKVQIKEDAEEAAEEAEDEAEEALERKFLGKNYEAAQTAIREHFDFTGCYIDTLMGMYLDKSYLSILKGLRKDSEDVQKMREDKSIVMFDFLAEDKRQASVEKYVALCDSEKLFQEGEKAYCFLDCGVSKRKKGILVTSKGLYFTSSIGFRIPFMAYDGIDGIKSDIVGCGDIIYKGKTESTTLDEKIASFLTLTILYYKYGDISITGKMAADMVSQSETDAHHSIWGEAGSGKRAIGSILPNVIGIGFWIIVIIAILRACHG